MPMAPYVIVLAKNTNEGSAYVRRANLPRGRWRIASSASSIRGLRRAHVHKLPTFDRRPDKHSILAELRHAQCEWFDVEMPPRAQAPVRDQGDGMGQQTEIFDLLGRLDTEDALLDELAEAGVDPEPIAAKIEHNGQMREAIAAAEAEGLPALVEAEDVIPDVNAAPGDLIDPEVAELAAKRRRRTRCKDCNTLHLPEDDCPEPATDLFED